MSCNFVQFLIVVGIPNLGRALARTKCQMGALLIPMDAADRVGIGVQKLEDFVAVCIPEIESWVKSDRQYVARRPLEEIEVEVILEARGVKDLEGSLRDVPVLWIKALPLVPIILEYFLAWAVHDIIVVL